MIFSKTGNITVITQETKTVIELVKGIEQKYDSIKNDNIIVNLFSINSVSVDDLNEFISLSNKHKDYNKSFVVVCRDIDFNDVSEKITAVPTLQEAHDIIEMEEIERDLGI